MKTLSIIASLMLAVSTFGQAVSRTELRATNTILLAEIAKVRTNGLPFLVVTNHGILNDGVDHVVELQALHEAYKDRGAIVFFPDGTNYVINGARFHMPTNTGVTPPQQAPFYWIGAGSQRKGQSVGAHGGTIINWGFTNGPYKVFSGGLGRWKLSGITHRIQSGREANWFMLSTFTTLDWEDFALLGSTSGSNALARWFRFGTDQPVENYTDWSTNANAQGYGTIMRDWYSDKSRTIFELRDAANNYRFERGFAGHGMGGDKMFIIQTNGPGGIVDILFDGLGIEGTSTTNIFYMDGVSVATFRDIGIYDPVITSTAYVATASSSALKVEDGFVDNGFRKFNVPSRFDIRTSVSGATNHTRNYWEFNSTMTVRASVPIAYIHSDGSYTYWQVNDNGITQYWVDSLGSAVEQHRWTYAGSTVSLRNEGFHMLKEISAPGTPASGYGSLYAKTDGKVYWKDDAGTETDLTSGGSGTPGGSSLQVQFNMNSTFAGNSQFTFAPLTGTVSASNFAAAATVAGSTLLSSNPIPGSANAEVTLLSTNLNGNYFSLQASTIHSNLVLLAPTNGFAGITDPVLKVINVTGTGGNHTGQLAFVSQATLGGGSSGTFQDGTTNLVDSGSSGKFVTRNNSGSLSGVYTNTYESGLDLSTSVPLLSFWEGLFTGVDSFGVNAWEHTTEEMQKVYTYSNSTAIDLFQFWKPVDFRGGIQQNGTNFEQRVADLAGGGTTFEKIQFEDGDGSSAVPTGTKSTFYYCDRAMTITGWSLASADGLTPIATVEIIKTNFTPAVFHPGVSGGQQVGLTFLNGNHMGSNNTATAFGVTSLASNDVLYFRVTNNTSTKLKLVVKATSP